jgi:hypothetical protein
MPLPVSRSALDRLGYRLAQSEVVADGDLEELSSIVAAYQEQLDQVEQQLISFGFAATTRVKTIGTLVEKLQREHGMRLSQVQDVAGARIVVQDQTAQDEATTRLTEAFSAQGHSSKASDRRGNPSHGYRAVHLIVTVDRIPIEIQIRTELQDTWAQIMERLADRWGRGIRYGEPPESPELVLGSDKIVFSRADAVRGLATLSDMIASLEESQKIVIVAKECLQHLESTLESLGDPAVDVERPDNEGDSLRSTIGRLSEAAKAKDADDLVEVLDGWDQMSSSELIVALQRACDPMRRLLDETITQQDRLEANLRGTLQVIAQATERE